jgi:hypothetical protein
MADTYVMKGVSVDGFHDTKLKQLFRRIGLFFNPIKIDSLSGNTEISNLTSTADIQAGSTQTGTNGISGAQLANSITGIGAITNTVFGFLGQSEQTKQSKYQLEALTKQKELSALQGEIGYNLKKLEADIELKKQELAAAQKADSTKNTIRVALAFGGLFFLGFIVYLVFKRSDTQAVPAQATVQTPVPLV